MRTKLGWAACLFALGAGVFGTACGSYRYGFGGAAPSPAVSALAFASSRADTGQEEYNHTAESAFLDTRSAAVSTFSIDVDTASYSNVRRILRDGRLPPADAVRIEEMINYFGYDYPAPRGEDPVGVSLDVAACPWEPAHKLVSMRMQARKLAVETTPPRNLVFLLDVSGSMSPANRLPMIVKAMRLLVDQLNQRDSVAIVVYAGQSGLALPATPGDRKGDILAALAQLEAGGSTNGAAGIRLAYDVARAHFRKDGVNRVILATDGDFNVGVSSQGELVRMIEAERGSGVFLTVLGVGEGNLRDSTMEMLADKGNGNYAYLDSLKEAERVLVQQASGTLVTVAQDVKVQVEFNPAQIAAYRLIGYENRLLAARDFKDDSKDAGDMGAGHAVTALYEVIPAAGDAKAVAALSPDRKYQAEVPTDAACSGEWLTLKVRFKAPSGSTSTQRSFVLTGADAKQDSFNADTALASAVAELGLLLRSSQYKAGATYAQVLGLLDKVDRAGKIDQNGERRELRELVTRARQLSGEATASSPAEQIGTRPLAGKSAS